MVETIIKKALLFLKDSQTCQLFSLCYEVHLFHAFCYFKRKQNQVNLKISAEVQIKTFPKVCIWNL